MYTEGSDPHAHGHRAATLVGFRHFFDEFEQIFDASAGQQLDNEPDLLPFQGESEFDALYEFLGASPTHFEGTRSLASPFVHDDHPNPPLQGPNMLFESNSMTIDPRILEPAARRGPLSFSAQPVVSICLAGPISHTASIPNLPEQVQKSLKRYKYECETCHKTFCRESRRDRCQNGHTKSKPYTCTGNCGSMGCSKSYGSIEYLERHQDNLSTCSLCGKTMTGNNMARHKKRMHGDE